MPTSFSGEERPWARSCTIIIYCPFNVILFVLFILSLSAIVSGPVSPIKIQVATSLIFRDGLLNIYQYSPEKE